MKVDCAYDELIVLHKLTPNPRNNNKHSEEQIKRLAKIIDYQGMRSPVVVSRLSGFIVKGHCRLEAVKLLGWENIPVNFQAYESEAQEYADLTADNEIARWSDLDLDSVRAEIENFEIDVDLLGLNFDLQEDFSVPNGPSADDKLDKYLDKEFQEIKMEFSNEEYQIVIDALEEYRNINGSSTYSEILWRLLGLKS